MPLPRRSLLALVGTALAAPAFTVPALAAEDPRLTERAIGRPDAKVTAIEFFSLTCTHCAHFANATFPQVRTELIDTGKLRLVWRDYPLDKIALNAAMVARALPVERYEAFIGSLFASQDRWAFARGVNSTEELWKMAALAGMSRQTFDATIADQAFQDAIVATQQKNEGEYRIDSTPTFIINGKRYPGAMSFDQFATLVKDAAG